MGLSRPDGSFKLSGLLPGDYTLEIFEQASLLQIEGLSFPAGTEDVRIELPPPYPAISGRVVSPDGQPLNAIMVRTLTDTTEFRQGPQVRSDSQGEFLFPSLKPGCRIQADVVFPYVHVGETAQTQDPVICRAEHAARIRLTLNLDGGFRGGSRIPSKAYFLDFEGQPVTFVIDDIRYYRHLELPIKAVESNVFIATPMVVPIRAHELVFADVEGPIHTQVLALRSGQEFQISE